MTLIILQNRIMLSLMRHALSYNVILSQYILSHSSVKVLRRMSLAKSIH